MKDKNVCEVNKGSALFSQEHFSLPLQALFSRNTVRLFLGVLVGLRLL